MLPATLNEPAMAAHAQADFERATEVEVDVVDRAVGPHGGLRVEVDHVRAERRDVARGNDLAIYPEPVVGWRYRPERHRDEERLDARRLADGVRQAPRRLNADGREPVRITMRAHRRRFVEAQERRPWVEEAGVHRQRAYQAC